MHYRGEVITSRRPRLLGARAQASCSTSCSAARAELGVELRFRTEVARARRRPGRRRRRREQHAARALRGHFRPTLDRRRATYIWLGTDHVFDAFTFFIDETRTASSRSTRYPVQRRDEHVHRRDRRTAARRAGDEDARCEELFGLDGQADREPLAWLNFATVRNARWHHENVVLLGDAAHTAHFSIGSGTKLAMEDAIALAWAVRAPDAATLAAYEAERRPIVESTQRAAQGVARVVRGHRRYVHQPPLTFAFNLLTRSRRITHGDLRCATRSSSRAARRRRAADVHAVQAARARAGQPRRRLADGHVLGGRRHAGDFHLVHLGRARSAAPGWS